MNITKAKAIIEALQKDIVPYEIEAVQSAIKLAIQTALGEQTKVKANHDDVNNEGTAWLYFYVQKFSVMFEYNKTKLLNTFPQKSYNIHIRQEFTTTSRGKELNHKTITFDTLVDEIISFKESIKDEFKFDQELKDNRDFVKSIKKNPLPILNDKIKVISNKTGTFQIEFHNMTKADTELLLSKIRS